MSFLTIILKRNSLPRKEAELNFLRHRDIGESTQLIDNTKLTRSLKTVEKNEICRILRHRDIEDKIQTFDIIALTRSLNYVTKNEICRKKLQAKSSPLFKGG